MLISKMGSNALRCVKNYECLLKQGNFSLLKCRSLASPKFSSTSLSTVSKARGSSLSESHYQRSLFQVPVTRTCNTSQIRLASTTGDHVKLWQIERLVSVTLPVLLPAALILKNPVVDGLLAVFTVMHTHWGLEAIIIDYARPSVVGNVLPKVLHVALALLSVATLAGLFVLIYNGPGIGKAIRDGWQIGREERDD